MSVCRETSRRKIPRVQKDSVSFTGPLKSFCGDISKRVFVSDLGVLYAER